MQLGNNNIEVVSHTNGTLSKTSKEQKHEDRKIPVVIDREYPVLYALFIPITPEAGI